MANLGFCDKIIANRGKIAIRISIHTIAITIHKLIGFSKVIWSKLMRLRSWCRIGVLFLIKLSLDIMGGDCARSQIQISFYDDLWCSDNHLWCSGSREFDCFLLYDDGCARTGSNKVSRQTYLVILTFHFIAFGFPQAMKVIEPFSACLVIMIYDFFHHARTAVSRETSIANSQCYFSRNVICDFSQFFHKFVIMWLALNNCGVILTLIIQWLGPPCFYRGVAKPCQ